MVGKSEHHYAVALSTHRLDDMSGAKTGSAAHVGRVKGTVADLNA